MRDNTQIAQGMGMLAVATIWGSYMGYQLAYDHKDKRTLGAVLGGVVGYLALVTVKKQYRSQGQPVDPMRLNTRPIQVIGQ